MKQQYIIEIKIELDSIDAVGGMLSEIASHLDKESLGGSICKADGDFMEWSTDIQQAKRDQEGNHEA